MGLPRSQYVCEGQEGVHHCFSRCVRRAFLYGFDRHSCRDFSHRRAWIVDRLRHLAAIFAIEVCAKGRFWESRFQCQALLDEAAIAAGMVYVDLNLIRAGMAETPEESDFTSIQERIRAWKKETIAAAAVSGKEVEEIPSADRSVPSSQPVDEAK